MKRRFFKQVIDSCKIQADGTYTLKMKVEQAGVYILECPGRTAPEFACPTPDGKKNLGPQDFRGKYLVMDFWASWCGPCRGEIPYLKEAYEKYAGQGVAFFSVSIDKSDAAWKKALAEESMPWEQVCAPQAGKEVMKQYQFTGIPHILVLDKEGRIVGRDLRGKALMDQLEELLRQNKPQALGMTVE